jgi:uncharacterized membrane protein YiaA
LFASLLVESNAVASDVLSKTVMVVVVVVRSVKLSNSCSQLVTLAWQRSSIIVVVATQQARAIRSAVQRKRSNRMSLGHVDQSAFRVPTSFGACLVIGVLGACQHPSSHGEFTVAISVTCGKFQRHTCATRAFERWR